MAFLPQVSFFCYFSNCTDKSPLLKEKTPIPIMSLKKLRKECSNIVQEEIALWKFSNSYLEFSMCVGGFILEEKLPL